jgi:hypothetical protein
MLLRRGARAAALLALLGPTGCDLGTRDVEPGPGPGPRLIAAYPASGEGTRCAATDPDDCGVPTDSTIELRFDRHILPSTAVRQSIVVYSGSAEAFVFLQPEYDVVERVVAYRLPAGAALRPRTLYTVELVQPGDASANGFRAVDGAPLAEGPIPHRYSFLTARGPRLEAPLREPPPSCEEVLSVVRNAGCTNAGCHTSTSNHDPPMGLDLDGLPQLRSIVGRVARQTETGALVGTPMVDPVRFGVSMPLVQPGSPGTSYLVYKLLRHPANYRASAACSPDGGPSISELDGGCRVLDSAENACLREPCGSCYRAPLGLDECLPMSADESERLREWFVRGEPMPRAEEPVDGGGKAAGFDKAALRGLTRWIAGGARCP